MKKLIPARIATQIVAGGQKLKFIRRVGGRSQKGISMPEIMASITIMAILAGTGVTNAVGQVSRAKLVATMDEMKSVRNALMAYQQDNPGDTVSTITTLITKGYLVEGFTDSPDSDLETDWKEDAWGNRYEFMAPFIDVDGDYEAGYYESGGPDGELEDNPDTLDADETDDNIRITLESMAPGS